MQPVPPARARRASKMPGQPMRAAISIAVLEDDDSLRENILLPELREHGFDAVGAGDAAALYRQMLLRRFDLSLLDIGVPGEDGLSVAAHLRQNFPDIGIVMLTGDTDRRSHLQALANGADTFLPKPVDTDILMATLHRLAKRLGALREADAPMPSRSVRTGAWTLEADGWCLAAPDGKVLALTLQERRLMLCLAAGTPGEPVRREDIIAALATDEDASQFDPRRLDMLVHRLRRKVERTVGETPVFPLLAARGAGYLFVA